MKKFGILFLVLSLGLLPFKAGAIYKVDEDGNSIGYEGKPGEYHIMEVDEGEIDPSAPDQNEDLDKSVSDKDEAVIAPSPDTNTDSDFTDDTVRILAENNATGNTTDKNNTVFYAVGSGVLGMSLGAALVYFLTKKH